MEVVVGAVPHTKVVWDRAAVLCSGTTSCAAIAMDSITMRISTSKEKIGWTKCRCH